MTDTQDAAGSIRWGRGHVRHARIPEWIVDADVPDRAIRLYAVLAILADSNGAAKVRKTVLAKRLRCAKSSLETSLTALRDLGALEVVANARGDGSRAANSYVLHWSEVVVSRGTPPDLSGDPPPGE